MEVADQYLTFTKTVGMNRKKLVRMISHKQLVNQFQLVRITTPLMYHL